MAGIEPGLTGEVVRLVTEDITAHAMGSGAVQDHLESGQTTVGTRLDVRHLAATPVGMDVTARARLVAVDGRKLTYEVEADDAREPIGTGTHERFVVDSDRFLSRVAENRDERPFPTVPPPAS